MELISPTFSPNESIPVRFTCQGEDVSPPLQWSNIPKKAKSLTLIVDDPDAPDPRAPKMTWVHWILYNIPPYCDHLGEDLQSNHLPEGAIQGLNDWQNRCYGGPCPPIGRHRYFFKLYALDTVLPDLGGVTKADMENAMKGHILAKAELVGTFEK